MKERTYLIIVILLIVGLIVVGTISFWPTFWPQSTQNMPAQTVTTTNKSLSDASASIGYEIKASYPEVSGLGNQTTQETINAGIRSLVDKQVNAFKTALNTNQPTTEVPGISELVITDKVSSANNNVVSVWFKILDSQPGMAHPNNYNLVYNYDVQAGKELQLADLFTPGSNYVETLSKIAKKNLEAKPELKTIEGLSFFVNEGAGPKAENFQLFNLNNKSLILIFNPGTVAPEFASTQTVEIPLSELKDILFAPPVTP